MNSRKKVNICPNCGHKVDIGKKLSVMPTRIIKCEECKALITIPLHPTVIFAVIFFLMFYSIQTGSIPKIYIMFYALVIVGYMYVKIQYVPLKIKKMPGEYDEDSFDNL